ncbi:hypothetical protein Vretimale_12451, partial [Volvox reticuliferus]
GRSNAVACLGELVLLLLFERSCAAAAAAAAAMASDGIADSGAATPAFHFIAASAGGTDAPAARETCGSEATAPDDRRKGRRVRADADRNGTTRLLAWRAEAERVRDCSTAARAA